MHLCYSDVEPCVKETLHSVSTVLQGQSASGAQPERSLQTCAWVGCMAARIQKGEETCLASPEADLENWVSSRAAGIR